MRKQFLCILTLLASVAQSQTYFTFGTAVNPRGEAVMVDSRGIEIAGKKVLPVMGEIHYARVPEADWRREILKMKAGGVTMISTYVFWIHHEPEEGRWNWEGRRNLRRFVETCKECEMPLVIRIGPFCHGEVYQGGVPSWILQRLDEKNCKPRSLNKVWIDATERLYANIFSQVKGLLWKDGGPIIGVQVENESRGPWQYYQTLKDLAVEVGFDVPFYTRTGWPKLNGNEKFGELLPLFGDYADGFWDRQLTDMPADYPKAFTMKASQVSATIATETFGKGELADDDEKSDDAQQLTYPYLTCELGGGMMPSYHRRINIFDQDGLALAVCKVGSGSNLPGYYMYHGGTNPYDGTMPMSEMQDTPYGFTSYNDMPLMTYDFQSPLGEMGQVNESYHRTRLFHQFLADWGEELSQAEAHIINDTLAERGRFRFVNTYVRMLHPNGQSYVVDTTVMAQPFCKIGSKVYYIEVPGVKAKTNKNVLTYDKARRAYKVGGKLRFTKHDGGILYKDGNKVKEEWWERKKP
ncbi:MAG: beta-galactosidase, partial [Prevotellaceae bacterium]|nr:beta-galactosidase [Prevotellaceae bacterium]